MPEKPKLIAEAEEEFAAFKRALAGLTEAQMREIWCGTWGVREIVAHISGWHRELCPALLRLGRGEKPIPEGVSYDDVDAWNARFTAGKSSWATEALLAELDASHADFLRAARGVPEDRLLPGRTAYKIVDLNSRHHYQAHRDDILGWRRLRGI
ncbi:MAG: ClbS/DfsB family four-helix bundle protein [Candidatus Rokubacteria bacterium]|nr:ClbS/DfsB family four-helix bundle protein [Candidatus Rokubacteria bacterium]